MSSSNTTCLSGGKGSPLSSTVICLDGFYCPSNNLEHPPEICPPTPECRVVRLQEAHNSCDRAQGTYEPTVCQAGHYCSSGGQTQTVCPKGHYCPQGAVEPLMCSRLSSCPEGSEKQIPIAGLLCSFLLDIVVILVIARPFLSGWISQLRRGRFHIRAGSRDQVDPDSEKAAKRRKDDTTSANMDINFDLSQFFNPTGSDLASTGSEVTFRGLGMRPTKSGVDTLCPQDGIIPAGCFLGVMGPSGSGKSTFVNILTGRLKPTTGSVLIDGHATQAAESVPQQIIGPSNSNSKSRLRDLLALVPQDDIILPDMTVRENILHSSRLRIGRSWKDTELQEFIDHLISRLGLYHVRHRLVGEVGEKGISGGERKRVNIALELAAAPSILVCDEPTSGLDAKTAFSLITLLQSLKNYGVTVICVLHQPRPEIFASLDNLLLLDYGRQVYFGPAAAAQQCFEHAGHRFPLSSNPADVIIDIMSCHDRIDQLQPPKSVPGSPQQGSPALLQYIKRRRAPWYRQVFLTFLRGMKQKTRQYPGFILEILTGASTGLLIGLSNYEFNGHLFQGLFHPPFQPLSSPVSYRLLTEQGLLLCLTIGCAAAPAGVKTFGDEKLIFTRESSSGHSESAYFLGKILSTLIRMFLSALHFTAFYLILTSPIVSFQTQLIVNLLYFYCIYGAATIVSALTSPKNGPLIAMLCSVLFCASSGCAPRLATVKGWNLAWLWYICPGVWLSEANFNEYTSPLGYLYDIGPAADVTGFTRGRTGFDLWMLFVLGTVYHLVAFVLFMLFLRKR